MVFRSCVTVPRLSCVNSLRVTPCVAATDPPLMPPMWSTTIQFSRFLFRGAQGALSFSRIRFTMQPPYLCLSHGPLTHRCATSRRQVCRFQTCCPGLSRVSLLEQSSPHPTLCCTASIISPKLSALGCCNIAMRCFIFIGCGVSRFTQCPS